MPRSQLFAPAIVTIALIVVTESASAQVCNGSAPFSKGMFRLGVILGSNAAIDQVARIGGGAAGVQLAVGSTHGPFVSVGRSVVYYNSATRFEREGFAEGRVNNAIARLTTASAGYALSVVPSKRIELCPIAGVTLQQGPTLYRVCDGSLSCSGRYEGKGNTRWLSAQIGAAMGNSPTFTFLPFVGIAYVNTEITAETSDGASSSSADYVGINTGIGIVIKRLTIRPSISLPAGLDGGKRVTGVDFIVSIGAQTPAH